MNILLTGGAGYIGSVTSEMLIDLGHNVVVYDNLSTGHQAAVHPKAIFVNGDVSDKALLEETINANKIEACVHFGAASLVGESMSNPSKYFSNNVSNGICLLDALVESGVPKIIFSSTAAVYGIPETFPIMESCQTEPTNPYGESKLAFEKILQWYSQAYDLSFTSLRYFNAAGASKDYGEDHYPETHLIPLILKTAMGKREKISVYGNDYPTKDGTCIRDYIHVQDLAKAHILALTSEKSNNKIYNLGNGNGYSVLEVIQAAKKVTGKDIPIEVSDRRAGDPPVLIASSKKISEELGWIPKSSSIENIIETAWKWHLKYPGGYSN